MPTFAFFAAAVLLAVTPGPGIAYVVARTAAGGRALGLASCLGTGVGGAIHVGATALGLSVLLARSATAFTAVKWAGAAYLVYLGVRLCLAKAAASPRAPRSGSGPQAFLEGIAVEAFDVKTALFFLAFLPQFVVAGRSVAGQLVVMGAVCVVLNTLVDVAAVLGAARLLRSEAVARRRAHVLGRASGATLIALGVGMATAEARG